MPKFAYNEAGRIEAITYLKVIRKYEYIRGVVHELSLDLVDYANFVFEDKEHAFFLPKDGELFKNAGKARHYLYFKGKLKELNKIIQNSSNVIGYANALRAGKGKAYIKKQVTLDSVNEQTRTADLEGERNKEESQKFKNDETMQSSFFLETVLVKVNVNRSINVNIVDKCLM